MANHVYFLETLHARFSGAVQTTAGTCFNSHSLLVDTLFDTESAFVLEGGRIPPGVGPGLAAQITGFAQSNPGGVKMFVGVDATNDFMFLDGVLTDNSQAAIESLGTNSSFIGAGRSSSRQLLQFRDDCLTALNVLGANSIGDFNISEREGAWLSPVGCALVTDSANANTAASILFERMRNAGVNHTLPDGTVILGAGYSGIGPDGTVTIDAADYGNSFPSNVTQNTPAAYGNNPNVFYTQKGCSTALGTVVRVAGGSISQANALQPVGIYAVSEAQLKSTWLFVIDGNPIVCTLAHADLRRPRDIWNQVIAPAVERNSGGNNRLPTIDPDTEAVNGTIGRLQYLDFARYLGPVGNTQQNNTSFIGF